jgi:hypothetical protein
MLEEARRDAIAANRHIGRLLTLREGELVLAHTEIAGLRELISEMFREMKSSMKSRGVSLDFERGSLMFRVRDVLESKCPE